MDVPFFVFGEMGSEKCGNAVQNSTPLSGGWWWCEYRPSWNNNTEEEGERRGMNNGGVRNGICTSRRIF